ncbi:MAG TPA: porin [Methylomirabilota bacterium]|nr:porin [Methylomirabilota bacterium]
MHAHERPTRGRVTSHIARVAVSSLLTLACGCLASAARAQYADTTTVPPPGSAAVGIGPSPPRVGGYIQARMSAVQDIGFNAFLNRARASVDGALPYRFAYRLLVEFQASAGVRSPATVSLREAVARWSPSPWALTAGEFKTPFTREYLIPVPQLEMADLAVAVDSIAPKYDVGVMGEVAAGPYANVYVGVFNGEGANAMANRDSVAIVIARVTTRPLPQLALGGSYSRDSADSLRWGVDGVITQSGALVRAEYLTRHVRGRDTNRDDWGWYVMEGLRVLPRVQLYARQEDFQRPSYGLSRRVRSWQFATNYDIAPGKVRLLLQFTRRVAGAKNTRIDTALAQVQVQL